DVPPIMLIDINHDRLRFDEELAFDCNGSLVRMKLGGIVYGGQVHFTSRFIDINGTIRFHDGISTGRNCIPETNL
ncbi:hypothetical protein B0H17DRAFT_908206, partial [Mycena rosella]